MKVVRTFLPIGVCVLIGFLLSTPLKSNFAGQFGLAVAISICLYIIYLYIKTRSGKREPDSRS